MNGPKASLDNCGNCVYWERISNAHGICHIISYPWDFQNKFAYITALGEPATYGNPRGKADADINGALATAQTFHCTLYKVSK